LAVEKMKEVYQNVKGAFVVSDIGVAEIIKYVNNAFHALKITFANEIGNICKKLGIDSHKVMEIFCMDKKLNLSSAYLKPGFAYGGSCLPKDLKALKTILREFYLECPVLENIERSNEIQKKIVLEQILAFEKRRVGFLGLSFKAGTDDLRNSPIIDIIEQLLGKGLEVRIYDRHVHLSKLIGANRDYILSRIPLISQFITDKIEDIIEHSEVIVVVNKIPDLAQILDRIGPNQIVYDFVNVGLEKIATSPRYLGIAW
jgi:GDP-mannose 6-dehydrogenase